jgi:hypothetical protein
LFNRTILVLYCGVLFFYGINAGSLYKTEALRAIVANEFLRTGNWIVPTLYGEPLLTKPPIARGSGHGMVGPVAFRRRGEYRRLAFLFLVWQSARTPSGTDRSGDRAVVVVVFGSRAQCRN